MISIEGVTRLYGSGAAQTAALQNISLEIPSGQFVAIVGTSGSGKTTLLNILGGLDRSWKAVRRSRTRTDRRHCDCAERNLGPHPREGSRKGEATEPPAAFRGCSGGRSSCRYRQRVVRDAAGDGCSRAHMVFGDLIVDRIGVLDEHVRNESREVIRGADDAVECLLEGAVVPLSGRAHTSVTDVGRGVVTA